MISARHIWQWVWRSLVVLFCLVLVSITVPVLSMTVGCPATTLPPEPPTTRGTLTPESTYLTYPEWYIVYSAEEEAAYLQQGKRPSQFPYAGSVAQYWCGYRHVFDVTNGRYPFNGGNHLVLGVIGVSFSVEQLAKGVYEHTVGWQTELFGVATPEDTYAAGVAHEYGAFLHTIPWYAFPFWPRLGGLWQQTPLVSADVPRSIERKTYLSAFYGIKGFYGWVIGKATGAVFAPAEEEIRVGIQPAPAQALKDPQIKVTDSGATLILPRYGDFTIIMTTLAGRGVQFTDIAGNTEILLTVIAPRDWQYTGADVTTLFSMNILTDETKKRVALNVPVRSLGMVLSHLQTHSIFIEHLYDY